MNCVFALLSINLHIQQSTNITSIEMHKFHFNTFYTFLDYYLLKREKRKRNIYRNMQIIYDQMCIMF